MALDVTGATPITFFLIFINLGLYVLPFVKDFSKNEYVNVILKRGCWVIAIYLSTLNFAIMHTISTKAELGIGNEMSTYMFLAGLAGYVMMGYMVIMLLFNLFTIKKNNDEKRRMGEYD